MRIVKCERCGSSELKELAGYVQCIYCQSKFVLDEVDLPPKQSTIGVGTDIDRLLEKCRTDQSNRRRYASLVLDIDPTNAEALRYLGQ